jgi:hypothetical protein
MLEERMIHGRKSKHSLGAAPEYIHVQEERTKALISGFASDGRIRLTDDEDNVWSGVVEREDDMLRYRLKDGGGRHMTGYGHASVRVFRDDRGRTWRGVAG